MRGKKKIVSIIVIIALIIIGVLLVNKYLGSNVVYNYFIHDVILNEAELDMLITILSNDSLVKAYSLEDVNYEVTNDGKVFFERCMLNTYTMIRLNNLWIDKMSYSYNNHHRIEDGRYKSWAELKEALVKDSVTSK